MNDLAGFVTALDGPEKLKVLVHTLGFCHLHFDVTVPRAVNFRGAIMDLFRRGACRALPPQGGNMSCVATRSHLVPPFPCLTG